MMKKIFASALAVAMVVSMASVSFAVVAKDFAYGVNSDGEVSNSTVTTLAYGKTFYHPIWTNETDGVFVDSTDAVIGMKVKPNFTLNGSAVEKVEIVKKKVASNFTVGATGGKYYYFLAISTKANSTTAVTDVIGKIELTRSARKINNVNYPAIDDTVEVSFALGYGEAFGSADPRKITSTTRIFDFGTSKLNGTEEDTLTFDGGEFLVNTKGQGKILLSLSTSYKSDIAAKYPAANLDFMTFNGTSFNKVGELTFEEMEGKFLYLNNDGVLTAVKGVYDEYAETLTVKTRTLGAYVISDVELNTAVTTPDVKPNPGTGANA